MFYSFPWSKIEQLVKQGRKSGKIYTELRSNVERPITAILTLNTVANTAGASIAGAAWANVYGHETLGWFAAGFTVTILIFSEILPKTLGVVYNRQLAPVLARPIAFMVRLFIPVIWVGGSLARMISARKSGSPVVTEDDIRAMASLTCKAGVIKPYEELSIRNILSLDTKTVERIMTPRTVVFSLSARLTVAEARKENEAWPHSRIPVYEGDDPEDIVGVVLRREVFETLANDQDHVLLSDIMKPVRFVLENLTLDKLLINFLECRIHLFVVLDEYGGLAGVVTLEDVFEEILGSEIVDDSDEVVDMRELARKRRRELMQASQARAEAQAEAEKDKE